MANLITTTGVVPRSVETSKRHYNVMSESLSGRIQVRSLNNARREFTIEYPPMTRADFKAVYDFIDALGGSFATFTIYVPDPSNLTAFDFTTGDGCVEVEVRLKNDTQEFAINNASLYEYELDVVEVL